MSTLFQLSVETAEGSRNVISRWNGDYDFADKVAQHVTQTLQASDPWEEEYVLNSAALDLFPLEAAMARQAYDPGHRLIVSADSVWLSLANDAELQAKIDHDAAELAAGNRIAELGRPAGEPLDEPLRKLLARTLRELDAADAYTVPKQIRDEMQRDHSEAELRAGMRIGGRSEEEIEELVQGWRQQNFISPTAKTGEELQRDLLNLGLAELYAKDAQAAMLSIMDEAIRIGVPEALMDEAIRFGVSEELTDNAEIEAANRLREDNHGIQALENIRKAAAAVDEDRYNDAIAAAASLAASGNRIVREAAANNLDLANAIELEDALSSEWTPEPLPTDAGLEPLLGDMKQTEGSPKKAYDPHSERDRAEALLDILLERGMEIRLQDEEEVSVPWTTDKAALMENIDATDFTRVSARPDSNSKAIAFDLVWGNEASELIADHSDVALAHQIDAKVRTKVWENDLASERELESLPTEGKNAIAAETSKPEKVVITHPEMGIYLGNALGLGLWSKLDTAGQPEAVVFDGSDGSAAAKEHVSSWDDNNDPESYNYVRVAVEGDYADVRALTEAKLGPLLGGMAFEAARQDLVSHRNAWLKAMDMAVQTASREHDQDDLSYWQHERNAFNRTFEQMASLSSTESVPDDMETHRAAWRKALELAEQAEPSEEDRSFWRHEIGAFDRTFDAIIDPRESPAPNTVDIVYAEEWTRHHNGEGHDERRRVVVHTPDGFFPGEQVSYHGVDPETHEVYSGEYLNYPGESPDYAFPTIEEARQYLDTFLRSGRPGLEQALGLDGAEETATEIQTIRQGQWISDDGLYERQILVGKSQQGYHGGYAISHRGGEPGEVWDETPHESLDAANEAAYALYRKNEVDAVDEDFVAEHASERKYELLDEPNVFDQQTFRIRALRDIPEHRVRAGDLGGWIASEANLSHEGASWVAENATVYEQAVIEDDALVRGYVRVSGNARMRGQSLAEGNSLISGNAILEDQSRIREHAYIYGDSRLSGTVSVGGGNLVGGETHYREQSEVPYDFSKASGTEADYLDRLKVAVEKDPAFHRYFAALGAETPEQRGEALHALWYAGDRRKGRQALVQASAIIGGTFVQGEYIPKDARDVATSLMSEVNFSVQTDKGFTNYRTMEHISSRMGAHPENDAPVYPAVVKATVEIDGRQDHFYQPALLVGQQPENPTMVPVAGRVAIFEEAYDDWLTALRRSDYMVGENATGAHLVQLDSMDSMKRDVDLSSLPLVIHSVTSYRPDGEDRAITIQVNDPNASDDPHFPGARLQAGLLTLHTPIDREINIERRFDLSAAVETVRSMKAPDGPRFTLYGSTEDFLAHTSGRVEQRNATVAKLREDLDAMEDWDSPEANAIHERLSQIDPSNTNILHKVSDTPIPGAFDGEQVFPTASEFRYSNAINEPARVGYHAGSLTLKNGVETDRATFLGQKTAPHDTPEEAIQAAEKAIHAHLEWLCMKTPAQESKQTYQNPSNSFDI